MEPTLRTRLKRMIKKLNDTDKLKRKKMDWEILQLLEDSHRVLLHLDDLSKS